MKGQASVLVTHREQNNLEGDGRAKKAVSYVSSKKRRKVLNWVTALLEEGKMHKDDKG